VSRQPNKKWKYRIILIFLCAAIGGWFGWWLATPFFIPGIGTIQWPFPPATTIVVCALIAGLVVCRAGHTILKRGDGWTPLHKAAYEGYREIVELLIAKGADVNAKNKRGMTPLHLAAEYGRNQVVELLIAKGADVNAEDEDGETPLNRAIKVKQTDLADRLRKHGGKTGEELKGK
jgi:hypothetical protein